MNIPEKRIWLNWKEAKEQVIGIGRNLQADYRGAGILQWIPVGGNGKKPMVFYTLGQLYAFREYLREFPQEAARRLKEYREAKKKRLREERLAKKRLSKRR